MIYDYVIEKPPLDELFHHGIKGQSWGKKNGPPYPLDSSISTGNKLKKKFAAKKELKEAKKRLAKQEKEDKKIDQIYQKKLSNGVSLTSDNNALTDIKISKENDYFKTSLKNKNNSEVTIYGNSRDVSEENIAQAARLFYKNRDTIRKHAFDILENDDSQYSFYKTFAEPIGISKKEMKDKLDIKSFYVTKINGNLYGEISIYEKDGKISDLTGGHTIDFDIDVKSGKLSKYYAVNG